MAYNFLKDTPAWGKPPLKSEKAQARFTLIFEMMDENYSLKRQDTKLITADIAERFKSNPTSTAVDISIDTSTIKQVVDMLKKPETIRDVTKKIATSGPSGAKKERAALKVYDNVGFKTWDEMVSNDPNLKSTKSATEQKAPAVQENEKTRGKQKEAMLPFDTSSMSPSELLEIGLRSLKESFVVSQNTNENLRIAIRNQDRTIARLSNLIETLHSDAIEIVSSESGPEPEKVFSEVYGLPTVMTAIPSRPTVHYSPAFIKAFKKLDRFVQDLCIKQIKSLCEHGWKKTIGSQQHEKMKFERRGLDAPVGSFIARVSKQYRYMWAMETRPEGQILVLYFICKHDVMAESER